MTFEEIFRHSGVLWQEGVRSQYLQAHDGGERVMRLVLVIQCPDRTQPFMNAEHDPDLVFLLHTCNPN